MTRTIIGSIIAAFITAGVGATTVYQVHKSRSAVAAEPVEAASSANVEVLQNGERRHVRVGPIDVEQGPDGQRATIGKSISAQQTKNAQSVKVGRGIAVRQNGQDSSVQVGGTRVETSGNQRHVKIGGLEVSTE
jgi:hypothetical protein